MGRLHSNKIVSRDVLQNTMEKVWRTSCPFKFIDIYPSLFVIKFDNLSDKNQVLHGRPWLFDRSSSPLKLFEGRLSPAKMDFNKESFWVQMHNLPLTCMNEVKGHSIGSTIGTVMDCDVSEDGTGWEKALRVLIEIHVYQPLPHG